MCCPVKNLAELADLSALHKRCHRQGVWCVSSDSPIPISLHKGHGSSLPSRHSNRPELTDYPHSKLQLESVIYSPTTEPQVSGWKLLLYCCTMYIAFTVPWPRLLYRGHFNFILPWTLYFYYTVDTLILFHRGHFTFTQPWKIYFTLPWTLYFTLPWTLLFYSTVDTLILVYRGHFTFTLPWTI